MCSAEATRKGSKSEGSRVRISVRVLDQLGHDQRGGEEGERRPVRAAEQLERRNAERGEAERDHSGVRGQRAHVLSLSVPEPLFL